MEFHMENGEHVQEDCGKGQAASANVLGKEFVDQIRETEHSDFATAGRLWIPLQLGNI
jgi:hypothetical protein